MSISDEAVEAAARAIRENRTVLIPAPEGEYGSSLGYRSPEELAQLALVAAAPHLMAQAWDEGYQGCYDRCMYEPVPPNPYRSAGAGE